MAKESGSSRIPRLDGTGTRIPLPSSLRNVANIATQQSGKSLLLKNSLAGNASKRPSSFAALTPPFTNNASNLKKSSSGERLNNVVHIVSRKTTTALKRFFGTSQQNQPKLPTEQKTHTTAGAKSLANDVTVTISAAPPRTTFTRSETFIRSQNELHLLEVATSHGMAQSTPTTTNLKSLQGTRINFQNTKTFDETFTPNPNAYNARHLTSDFDQTVNHTIGKTFNGTMEMCKTMTVVSPLKSQQMQKDRKSGIAQMNANQTKSLTLDYSPNYSNMDIDMTQIIKTGKSLMSSPGIATPATDATFSNPGSVESLQMIEDVSVPSGFDMDITLQPEEDVESKAQSDIEMPLAPDKANLKLPLNSTMNTSRLLDFTSDGLISPESQFKLLNITKDGLDERKQLNSTQLLYMSQHSASATTTPDMKPKLTGDEVLHNISPYSLKSAQSDLVLPTQTPDDASLKSKAVAHAEQFYGDAQSRGAAATAISLQDVSNSNPKPRSRFSFGIDLTESTLDCSIELVDVSISSNATARMGNSQSQQSLSMQQLHAQQQQQQILKKQNSIDMDESLGILTPDQMKEFLDSTATNTNNLELPLGLSTTAACLSSNKQQLSFHQIRMDQTPSPEELPLDPVEVKTDFDDQVISMAQQQHQQQQAAFTQASHKQQTQQLSQQQTNSICTEPVSLHTDTELSKTEPIMTKSNVSRISTSFITSVTSVTSLDTGYQGDGEMSRPASRGAGDHSPSNGPAARRCGHVSRQPSFNQQFQQQNQLPPIRRQDPMTDSDFFTESDADDLLHRGDRRAQVIDGQLYNCPTLNSAASVFISEDPQMEDSCMESSGIFTDVENRCEEDLAQMRRQDVMQDMSPDGEADDSTETVKSNRERNGNKSSKTMLNYDPDATIGQGQPLQHNSSSNTIPSHSCSADRLSATISNRTSYCSVEEAFFDDVSVHKNVTKSQNEIDNKVNGASKTVEYNESPAPKKIGKSHFKSGTGSFDSGASKAKQNKCIANAKGNSVNSKSVSELPITVRKVAHAPNKWDVVMNKIASNKAAIRKNYNDVKSKVSTTRVGSSSMGSGSGASSPTTPTVRRTPVSGLNSGGSSSPITSANKTVRASKATVSTTPTGVKKVADVGPRNGSPSYQAQTHSKRLLQGATKRGRSCSKDSQKSSQSDLSMASGAGSPKNLAKAPIRAAKKRDVRNLNISPTDLGPPPKAQQTANGASTRMKASVIANAKKCVLSSVTSPQNTSATNSISSNKSSSTSPTNLRRGTVKINSTTSACSNPLAKTAERVTTSTAVITKDSNRLSNIEQSIETGSITSTKNGIRTGTATELKEINCIGQDKQQEQQQQNLHTLQHNINNNHSIPKITSEASKVTSVELDRQHVKKSSSAGLHSGTGALASITEKKLSPKTQNVRKSQFQKQQKASSEDKPLPPSSTSTEYLDPRELAKLRLVNRHSCNGRLDFVSLEQELQQAENIRLQQDKSIGAMGVLIQYLVYELDAFSCPKYKNESIKAQDAIQKTTRLLDEAKYTCTQLQDQLCDKEMYYAQREEELQSLHRCELEKARAKYSDLQKEAKEEIAGLENQLCERDINHQHAINCYRLEMENKFTEQFKQMHAADANERELKQRLAEMEAKNRDLQLKLKNAEVEALQEANAAAKRERSFEASIAELTNEFETLRARKTNSEREERRDKSELSHDEIAILRPSRSSFDSRINLNSTRGIKHRTSLPTEISRLENEVESLRCVLEMRQSEISRLTKQNEELMRDADDRAAMSAKISKLNADIEMLRSELDIKTEKEKEYQIQLDKIQKDVSYEKTKSTRLGYDNEALQWQLKQRSEQLHIVEAKLHESLNSSGSFSSSTVRYSSQSSYSGSSRQTSLHADNNISPPLSPVIKAVIQKPDSVSYVLEIDDETPEIAASKLVKRASSFRSIERGPVTTRRQNSLSANTSTSNNSTSSLSQSMSTGSVVRQHSSDSVSEHGHGHARTRSRSVSVKDETSGQVLNELLPPMEFPYNSSPYPNSMRPRTSTMMVEKHTRDEQDEPAIYKRLTSASKCPIQPPIQPRLITCDISALNSGERLDERMLPSHPSIHDLKVPKQIQQIKEFAGEAMVSGANSEDEGCSASSDDMVSMHSSTSTDISAASAPLNILEAATSMSLEQVLLMDKINSLSGTPMEMSWSDDVIESRDELPHAAIASLNASSNA